MALPPFPLPSPGGRAAAPAFGAATRLRHGFPIVRLVLLAATVVAAISIVARGCNYDVTIPARYFLYFGWQILLPGTAVLALAGVRRLTPSVIIALAIPTGFAVEIFTFLGFSAVGARAWIPLLPVLWAFAARRHWPKVWFDVTRSLVAQPGLAAALGLLCLVTVITAASQMYADAPLVAGLPQRPIFHDWMYLLSRAALIKHQWPLEDPSLAGTPLQYHYFLLVHVASASDLTGLAPTWVLLRLVVVPLGVVLVLQSYLLGKRLCRSRWAGVLAAFLVIVPGELSYAAEYDRSVYFGLFLRWLYVSPTFYFGVIFFGALLLAIPQSSGNRRLLAWIGLLAAAATAAKGSIVPVLALGMLLYAAHQVWRRGRVPTDGWLVAGVTGLAFALVYYATMWRWGTGAAAWNPFEVCHLTAFWNEHAIPWTRWWKRTLHAPDFGTWLGAVLTTAAITIGTSGVRLLALPYLSSQPRGHRRPLARWLAATAVASHAIGLSLHFDANSELYFLLLGRLPLGILAAGFVSSFASRLCSLRPRSFSKWRLASAAGLAAAVAVIATTTTFLQTLNTIRCNEHGVGEWLRSNPNQAINSDLLPLYETMAWLRRHTEPDAVLMVNAFTKKNIPSGRGVLVDHTTVGVHYYYSALSERRLWVEGPTYALDQAEAQRRLRRAGEVYYGHGSLPASLLRAGPSYIVIDHSIGDGAEFRSENATRVFANGRFEVFRLQLPQPSPLLTAAN